MISLELFDRAQCTREQKAGVVMTALDLLDLAHRSRREGLLSLEESIDTCTKPFLKKLLSMVCDSVEPEVVRSVGETSISISSLSGHELLDAMVTLEGALSIQKGENPHVTYLLLSAYLGNDVDLLDYEDPLQLQELNTIELEATETRREVGVDIQSIEKNIHNEIPLTDDQIISLNSSKMASNPFQDMQVEVLAIAMMYMEENTRRKVIESLSLQKQSEVIKAIYVMSDFDTASFIELARSALQDIVNVLQTNYKPAGGPGVALALLKTLPRYFTNTIMEELKKSEPGLAERLQDGLFSFDDIKYIDDRSIQKIIREVDSSDLLRSLKGASSDIVEKIFSNVSSRASFWLKEEMNSISPVNLDDIKKSRQKIISVIRHLEEKGVIEIAYRDDDLLIT